MRAKEEGQTPTLSDSSPALRSTEVPERSPPEFWARALRFQFLYSLSGLLLGTVCMLLGTLLFLFGLTGDTTWTASMMGFDSKLTDAAPGTVLFVVGLFVVVLTRYVVRIRPRKHA